APRDGGEGVGAPAGPRGALAGCGGGPGVRGGDGPMILVVDHYDSFVYNLVQLVEGLGRRTEVVRSDAEPAPALAARRPDAVILSPGPGRPEEAGCFVELIGEL